MRRDMPVTVTLTWALSHLALCWLSTATFQMIERSPKDLLSTSQKMRMSLKRLDDLKSELDGIQVTEEELNSISKHVSALEDVLTGSKKSVSPHRPNPVYL